MKRFLFYLFIYLFFYLIILPSSPVQAFVCTCRASCLANEVLSDLCTNRYTPDYCCTVDPTATPVPPPPPACSPPDCKNFTYPNCGNATAVCTQSGPPTCTNLGWQCTGISGGCSTWSSWSSCYPAPDCVQTKYCIVGNAQPQAQVCTNAPGCGGPGFPTNTPIPPTPIPTNTSIPTPTPTPTVSAGPWIKLKNSSFISRNSLLDKIPLAPTADDTAQAYFIINSAGTVAAPNINIANINPAAEDGGLSRRNLLGNLR